MRFRYFLSVLSLPVIALLAGCSEKPGKEADRPPQLSVQTASFYRYPEAVYFDMERCPTGKQLADIYPDGSNYNGMTVMGFLSPEKYIEFIAVPAAHPRASGIQIDEVMILKLKDSERRVNSGHTADTGSSCFRGAMLTIHYIENDTAYQEKFHCIIEDFGEMGAGMWANRDTWSVRIPEI